MSETRAMRFEALKQAVIDLNESTEYILAVPTQEVVALISKDIETAEALARQFDVDEDAAS